MNYSQNKLFSVALTAVICATAGLAQNELTKHPSSGIPRMLVAQALGMDPLEGEDARLVALAQATSVVAEASLTGQMNARNEALLRALSEAKRKIAAAVEVGEGEEIALGGCRLLDCVFTKSADDKNESVAVAVEWTQKRQDWSVSEALSKSRSEMIDVTRKQFYSPEADCVTVTGNATSGMSFLERIGAELVAKMRKESLPADITYAYFQPVNAGSYLREFVPSLATNRYDAKGQVLADVAGCVHTTDATRAVLGLHAMRSVGWGMFSKVPDKAVAALSSIRSVNDVAAINDAITNAVGSLRKPTIDSVPVADLLRSRNVEFMELPGPIEMYDREGFLHHLGCGIVPMDKIDSASGRSARKRAEQIAAGFATFPLAAHVSSEGTVKFINPDFRTEVVYSGEMKDEATSRTLAVVIVEALY